MLNAQWSMFNVQWSMFNVQCSMFNGKTSLSLISIHHSSLFLFFSLSFYTLSFYTLSVKHKVIYIHKQDTILILIARTMFTHNYNLLKEIMTLIILNDYPLPYHQIFGHPHRVARFILHLSIKIIGKRFGSYNQNDYLCSAFVK